VSKRVSELALAVFLCALGASVAHADLRIHPKRVIFEGSQRSATVTLVNNEPEAYTYRIMWQMLRMNEQGKLERVNEGDDPGDLKIANDMIRYAPRQIRLEPGVAQTVRIMLRKPGNLADGEYRAHMLFMREPRTVKMGEEGDKLAINLNILYGMSIPIFVRQGELDADVEIDTVDAKRAGDKMSLDVQFERGGQRSVYGDVTVSWFGAGGEENVLATVRGIGIYPEARTRRFEIDDLVMPDGSPVPPGKLKIRYRASAEAASETLAEATVAVN